MSGTNILSRRWAPEILLELASGPKRFNRLLEIPNISDRVLTVRLRDLEVLGLVERHVQIGRPVRVEYTLTDRGRRLIPGLAALQEVSLAS